MKNIDIVSLGIRPDTGDDTVPYVAEALDRVKGQDNVTLSFPAGRYDFYPDRAPESFYFISNNDDGLKRIAFLLKGFKNLIIDGMGSEFVFHGRITPFIIDGSSSITLRNFKIDWEDAQMFQGVVTGSGEGYIDIRLGESYDYTLEDGYLIMKGYGWREPVRGLLEVDPVTKAPAFGSGDHCGAPWHSKFEFEEIGDRLLRIRNKFKVKPAAGNILVLTSHRRDNPGIYVHASKDIKFENIDVYQTPAMALIAERSADISLKAFNVMLKPGTDRLYSAAADATHFVDCRGHIGIEDCLFENQLDDATNVHGIYARIARQVGEDRILAQLVHSQQKGAIVTAAGDEVRLCDKHSLRPYFTAHIKDISRINSDYFEVTLDRKLEEFHEADVLENLTWNPDVTIRNCIARNNRARSFLIGTSGHVVIEGNTFASGGAGVHIGAEGVFWFEAGPVKDVLIRNNRFINCNYGPWSRAAIDISPAVKEDTGEGCFESGVKIEGNRFETFAGDVLCAYHVEGLRFAGNEIVMTDAYPVTNRHKNPVELKSCVNAVVDIA